MTKNEMICLLKNNLELRRGLKVDEVNYGNFVSVSNGRTGFMLDAEVDRTEESVLEAAQKLLSRVYRDLEAKEMIELNKVRKALT